MAKKKTAPETGGKGGSKKQKKGSSRSKKKIDVVEKVIESIEQKIEKEDIKATLGDFIRLLQLRKELEEEQPREIEVTWVDPSEKEPASET
jgi:hypothetical protein